MRVLVLAVPLLLSLLAGCSGKADSNDDEVPEEVFDEFDVEAGAETGVVRGIAVDEAIRPVAGATISLTCAGQKPQSVGTNAAGAFAFGDLTPATCFLRASKPGYQTIQQSTEVIAGVTDPPLVRILLVADPATTPYFFTQVWEGFIQCSARYFIEGRALCQAVPGSQDNVVYDLELDGVPTMTQGELVWESTQQLGDSLSFNWRKTGTNADYIDTEGVTPLVLRADNALLTANGVGIDQPLRTVIFTGHNEATEPPVGGLWGVGVQVMQDFREYIVVTYNFELPEDYLFINDGEPVAPS